MYDDDDDDDDDECSPVRRRAVYPAGFFLILDLDMRIFWCILRPR